jgi:hypothetical protein
MKHSNATPYKQYCLGIVAGHLGGVWSHQRWANKPIFWDAMGGDGQPEPILGSPPSPIILSGIAHHFGFPFFVSEKDPIRSASLKEILQYGSVLEMPMTEAIPVIRKECPDSVGGVAYFDSFGPVPDLDQLGIIFRQFNRMDCLFNITTTGLKRSGIQRPSDIISRMNKSVWYVRKVTKDAWHWAFMLGTETRQIREMAKIGWFLLDTSAGRQIFEEIEYTKKEREELCQPELWQN